MDKEKLIARIKDGELSKEQEEKLEGIFPELKESEDAKIRKALLEYFSHYGSTHCQSVQVADILTWLEKQGEKKETACDRCRKAQPNGSCQDITALGRCYIEEERKVKDTTVIYHESGLKALEKSLKKGCTEGEQKPADKVEPKFKVGDWLQYRNAKPFFVEEITKQGYVNGDSCLPFNWENEIHLWTIQDAKDGDVLACGDKVTDCPFIFHNLTEELNPRSYCGVNTLGHFQDNDENGGFWCYSDKVRPATKEQRDQLEKAMADAGYTFDFEKKELEKYRSVQTPATTISAVNGAISTAITDGNTSVTSKEVEWQYCTGQYETDVREFPIEWKQENVDELSDFEIAMMHIGDSFFGENAGLDPNDTATIKEEATLLLELGTKQEWSEEDENVLEDIEEAIINYWHGDTQDILLNRLKSLKDRYTWKPSDEQMEAMQKALVDLCGKDEHNIITGLYYDLKKLR